MSTRYEVVFDDFTERHYIKKIVKKYSLRAWEHTRIAIVALCINADVALQTEKLETITQKSDLLICKMDFAIAGTGKSSKKSGCRCIVSQDRKKLEVRVLLVYCKNDVQGSNETIWWKGVIKENYPEYRELL